MDGYAVAYTALAKLALWRTVKISFYSVSNSHSTKMQSAKFDNVAAMSSDSWTTSASDLSK